MAFFDKLSDFAKNIGDMTGDAIETSKLQSKANSEKSLAGEELKKIGEFYYNLFASGGEVAPEVLEFCQSARAHYDAAAEAQAEIDRIKAENEAAKAAATAAAAAPVVPAAPAGGLVCAACGTANNPGVKFCQNCGGKLEAPPPAPAGVTCVVCGVANDPGTKFCRECGAKLDAPPAEPEPAPEPRLCSGCSTQVPDGVKFCPECGQKME